MATALRFAPFAWISAQVAGILLGLGALAFSPPAEGAIFLLPVGAQAQAATLPAALAGDARLIGPGPLPHSLIVYGDRARLAAAARDRSIFILAAPFAACGGAA